MIETHGSNGWAIAPSKSASGNAMLMSNSHLPWADIDTYFEVQLTAPGVTSYGAVWVGFPVLRQCFTEFVAWTQTTNGPTGADVYRLTLEGRRLRARRQDQAVRRRAADHQGAAGRRHAARRAAHRSGAPCTGRCSPIAAASPWRCASSPPIGRGCSSSSGAWAWRRTSTSGATAMRMQQLPIFHTMYADRDGHIMYVYNAAPPVRAHGDHAFWSGVIPGDRSDADPRRPDRAVRPAAAGDRSAERLGAELQRLAVDVDLSDADRSGEVRAVHRAAAEPHAALAARHPAAVGVGEDHARTT